MDVAVAKDPAIVGKYYRETLAQTKTALANLKDLVPGSKGQGYVIAGFGWHPGPTHQNFPNHMQNVAG